VSSRDQNQFLLNTAPDGAVKVEVFFKDETFRLTQKESATLLPGPPGRTFCRTFCPARRTRKIATSIATWCRDHRSGWRQNPKSRHKSRQTVGIPKAETPVPFRSMSLKESTIEDAALEWFLLRSVRQAQSYGGPVGELGYAVRHGPQLAPGEPAVEPACALPACALSRAGKHADRRDSFGEVVLVGRLREAILRLNGAIPEEARATIRPYRIVQISIQGQGTP
jgi:hypothetical protein